MADAGRRVFWITAAVMAPAVAPEVAFSAPRPGPGSTPARVRRDPGWTPRAGEVEPPVGGDVAREPRRTETLPGGLDVVAGEVVIKLKDSVGAAELAALDAQHGTRVVYRAPSGYRRLQLPPGKSVPAALAELQRDARVALVSANADVRGRSGP